MAGTATSTRPYRFGVFELDLDRGVLEQDGQVVAIRAKTFALLSYFAANPNRVITKDEVTRAVWARTIVTDDSIAQIVRDVRRVLGDASEGLLRTVPKRGFIFAEGVRSLQREAAASWSDGADDGPQEDAALVRKRRGGRAAIAVLPLRISTDESDQATALRDVLQREVVRDLSRLRLFSIISGAPAADADPGRVGRRLSVDYVAAGSLSCRGDRLIVEIDLVEAATGCVLLSERLDHPLARATGGGASGEIVAALAREMDLSERNRSITETEPDSWAAYYHGQWHVRRRSPAGNRAAAGLFAKAIELDPTFSRPYAGLSFTHWLKAYELDFGRESDEARRALLLARQALAADPLDPAAHCAYGRALWLHGLPAEAAEALRKAAALSPSYACGHYAWGLADACSSDGAGSIERDGSCFAPPIGALVAAGAPGFALFGREGRP